MRWYVVIANETNGPFEIDSIVQLAKQKRIDIETLVRDEFGDFGHDWMPLWQSQLASTVTAALQGIPKDQSILAPVSSAPAKAQESRPAKARSFARMVVDRVALTLSGIGVAFVLLAGGTWAFDALDAGGVLDKLKPSREVNQLPWTAAIKQDCATYRAAPNEIEKSQIFRAAKERIPSVVQNVRGKLARLATNQGGSELYLTINVGDIEFASGMFTSPIPEGTAVYNAAASMKEGQCVVFSASHMESSSIREESQVCDNEYSATFTSLRSCDAPSSSESGQPRPEPPPTESQEISFDQRLYEADDLRTAIKLLKARMNDGAEVSKSPAAVLLAEWMAQNPFWSEVMAMPDTDRAAAEKDSKAHLGRRMCVSGVIDQIWTRRDGKTVTFTGGITTASYDTVRFIAVGSSRNLVEGSGARFCGIFTGASSYENIGGGTTLAVNVVGAFDLPENRH